MIHSLQSFFDRLFAPILAKPERGVWLLMALQFIGWAVIPYWYDDGGHNLGYPPRNDIIGHTQEMRNILAYGGDMFSYVHPPPAMLITYWLNFGQGFLYFPHLAMGQIFVCVTFYWVYLLGVELFKNKKQALAAVFLLVLMTSFFGQSTTNFNHDIILMPFWVGLILIFYRATRPLQTKKANQHFYWLLFGVMAGIATFAKLTIGILLLAMMLWMLMDKNARAHLLTTQSPYVGAGIALILMGIHAYLAFFDGEGNLRLHYFDRLAFRGDITDINLLSILHQLHSIVHQFLIAAFILMVISFFRPASRPLHEPLHKNERNFAYFFCFAPILLTLILSVILAQPLIVSWLSSMFSLLGIALITLIYRRWHDVMLKLVLVSCCLFILYKPIWTYPMHNGRHDYSHALASAVAQKAQQLWMEKYYTRPPRIQAWGHDRNMAVATLLVPNSLPFYFWHYYRAPPGGAIILYEERNLARIKNSIAPSLQDEDNWRQFEHARTHAHIFEFNHPRDGTVRVGFIMVPPQQ